jgi:hypothetical protein
MSVAVAALLTLGSAPAARALTVGGPYSWWTWPSTGFYNIDQRLIVGGVDAGIHRFFAHQFSFVGGDAGYMGLQIGSSPGNTKIALFSIFRANGHDGPDCSSGTEVGVPFHTCRIDPYNWVTGREYRLRVWETSTDSQGTWYGAWVLDTVTGTNSYIGRLRVPLSWGGLNGAGCDVSWTERFNAAPAACSGIGWSRVRWYFPTANNGTIQISARSQVVNDGDCPTYVRDLDIAGAVVQEQGKSSTETSWCGNLYPTGFGPIARCTKTDPTSLFYGNFSPLTGGFTHTVGPLTAIDRREHDGSYPSNDGSGTFPFFGGPKVNTAFGAASYGEQRWANPVYGPLIREGSVNFITNQFYPDGGWLQDTGP